MSTPVIGIDLGTSTSAISVLSEGRPELLPDERGDRIVPSVVQLSPDGQVLVGSTAKSGAVTFHDRTVQEVKRLMGTDEAITLGEKTFTPEEIYALILRHLKQAAEAKLGEGAVQDVVIAVPARYENAAREATKRAAELAGLNVLRLINEPTAAALSYGLDRLRSEERVLVFDFGGGTLDVTILEMYKGILDVKTSVGDDHLGGMDVDNLLVGFFREIYQEQKGKALPPPEADPRAAQLLKEEAEAYKIRLSSEDAVQVDIPYLSEDGGISLMLSRGRLDDLMNDLVRRAMQLVGEALSRAKLTFEDIDVVLPIGGSSRIPFFRRILEQRWGKTIKEYENPDEAVCKGAAIAAGIELKQFDEEDGIMILDVSPHRLGVAVIKQVGDGQYVDDFFSEIIPKDAKLPAIEKRDYWTLCNGRDSIQIRLFEATTEAKLCRDHRLIAELPLNNIPGAADGEPVQVKFQYTMDGTLEVLAYCKNLPVVKVDGRFSLAAGTGQTEGTRQDARDKIDTLWQNSAEARRCLPLLEEAERLQKAKPQAAADLRETADALRAALAAGEKKTIDRRLDALSDLLFSLS